MKKAVIITTNNEIIERESQWDYQELQDAVGGWITSLSFGDNNFSAYINDEGKIMDLSENKIATALWYDSGARVMLGDYIAGNVVFVGNVDANGDDRSVPDNFFELAIKYKTKMGL